jgi:hypothetical protein
MYVLSEPGKEKAMIQRGYIKFTMGERNNKERKNNTVKNEHHLNDSA